MEESTSYSPYGQQKEKERPTRYGKKEWRKDIERWLLEPEQHSELMNGWRREMIGKPLQAMLEGRLSLRIHDGHLQLHDNDGHSS